MFSALVPDYHLCSMDCQTATMLLAGETGHMPVLTHMEKQAAIDSRRALYEALVRMGVASSFDGKTAEEIDALIQDIVVAWRASMTRQSNAGEVPL